MATNCSISATASSVGKILYDISYHYLLPVYSVLGLGTNVVLLVAFYRRSRKEQAYGYQVLQTVSKTLEVITFALLLIQLFRREMFCVV